MNCSCTTDIEKATVKQPTDSNVTLQSNLNTILLDKDNPTTAAIKFNWNELNYGVDTQKSYSIQIDNADGDFSGDKTIASASNSERSFTNLEFNDFLLTKLKLIPNQAKKLKVRVKSSLNYELFASYSTPIEITVTPFPRAFYINFEPVITTVKAGTEVTMNYKYTYDKTAQIYCAIELLNDWSWQGTVVGGSATVQPGTDATGSFKFLVPATTKPTANLTGLQNYKAKITLNTENWVWLTGSYPATQINITAP